MRIAFHNLGCKVNSYETEAMISQMAHRGCEIVPFEEEADVYVVNTCTVTNIADRKSRQMLHRAKSQNPEALVVAVGCYAQVTGERLLQDEAVDLIVGNDEKSRLPELIEQYLNKKEAISCLRDIGASPEYEELPFTGSTEKSRAYIKIEDGCNQFCTYCLIPYARGRVRSRRPENVLEEAGRLAQAGYKEIVLTGIHVASYGLDFPGDSFGRDGYGEPLASLIEKLAAIEGIHRIRLSSLEPRLITPSFAARLAAVGKLCPHFHLSLQSGSNAVLKRMNRHYDTEAFYREMCLLREAFDRPALTTDVIVGFPGESDAEFEESCSFLEKADFYRMHVFRYSRRKGTVADKMPDQVPETVKAARSRQLLRMSERHQQVFEEALIGQEREILIEEGLEKDGQLYGIGHSPEYVRLAVPMETVEPGSLQTVRVSREMIMGETV